MTRFFLCALLLAFVITPARAQDSESQLYDPSFTGQKNKAEEQVRQSQQQQEVAEGFIKPDVVQIAIVHPAYLKEDQFAIMMSVPDVISGCYKLSPLEYEAKFREPSYLDIKVKKYRRIAPEGNGDKACNPANKMSSSLMVLDRKDLQQRAVKEIHFSADAGTDTYKVTIDASHIELTPESQTVFKAQGMSGALRDRLSYDFSTSRTVILQVPMAQDGDELGPQIAQFARQHALFPAGDSGSGQSDGGAYFIDRDGHIADEIGPEGYSQIGTIKTLRPFDGPDGRQTTAVELSVFVTRPGTRL